MLTYRSLLVFMSEFDCELAIKMFRDLVDRWANDLCLIGASVNQNLNRRLDVNRYFFA